MNHVVTMLEPMKDHNVHYDKRAPNSLILNGAQELLCQTRACSDASACTTDDGELPADEIGVGGLRRSQRRIPGAVLIANQLV
jgi:hypothetical protein